MIKLPKLPTLPTLSRQERLLAVGVAIVVTLLLMDRVIISPWLRHLSVMRREIHELEHTLVNQRRLVDLKGRVLAAMPCTSGRKRVSVMKEISLARSTTYRSPPWLSIWALARATRCSSVWL